MPFGNNNAYNPLTGNTSVNSNPGAGGLSTPGYNPLTGDSTASSPTTWSPGVTVPAQANSARPDNVNNPPTQAPPMAGPASSGGSTPSGFNPQYQQNAGYNPLQYATLDTANQLANNFGANVIQTRGVGHLAPPPQNILDMGGGQVFNAGLTAQNVARYGADAARRMMEAEMALPGAYNPNWQNDDSVFNLNNREGMFQNVPGGAQARGSGYSGPTNNAATPVTGAPARPGNPAGQLPPAGGQTPYPSPIPPRPMQDPRFVGGAMGTFSNFANRNNFLGGGQRGRGGRQVNIQSLLSALFGIDLGAGGRQTINQGPRNSLNPGLMPFPLYATPGTDAGAADSAAQLQQLLSLLIGR